MRLRKKGDTGQSAPRNRRHAQMVEVFVPSETKKSYSVCDAIHKQYKSERARASDRSAYVDSAQSCSELSCEEGTSARRRSV